MSEEKTEQAALEKIEVIATGPLPIMSHIHVAEDAPMEKYGGEHIYLKINEVLLRITVDSVAASDARGHMVALQIEVNTPDLIKSFEAQDEVIRASATKH